MIEGRRVRLRAAGEGDRERMREILAAPEVARWWGDPDGNLDDAVAPEEGTDSYAIELRDGGETIGVIQSWEENEPDFRHAGIDLALHPDHQGRGYGPEAIAALARHLFEARGHHRITIDPAAANGNAIRAYERLGFKPVGVLRSYWRDPDGVWRDGLLMDLLAGELIGP
ncbi:aminoglycoside 6'-N-acetyltransferase [Conexibacter arvalis]|uniref:Aminoglycoside 6'-N-acetyltransferase n=1 Tax=Conexibacter arvalis TaxID=912552 RepID=A0A840I755_9ACTN|nr:aminoglycoside 6'-N-acetyltransferase [Conexibacter arvalis]